MKFIFVRHPETEANVNRIIYGRTDSAYSEKGRASIAKVVEEFSNIKIDAIYSSPLTRAATLAEAIAKGHGLGVIKDDRLQEMHFGLFENKTSEEASEIYGEGYDKFWHNFANFEVPEGESMQQVKDRTVDFLKEIFPSDPAEGSFDEIMKEDPKKAVDLHDSNDKTIVVVAHSIVIRGALSYMLNIPLEAIWHIDVKPASRTEVSYHAGFGVLTGLRA